MISVKNIPSNEKGGRAPGAPPLGSAHDKVVTSDALGAGSVLVSEERRESLEEEESL